jgi:hypothetical protein
MRCYYQESKRLQCGLAYSEPPPEEIDGNFEWELEAIVMRADLLVGVPQNLRGTPTN